MAIMRSFAIDINDRYKSNIRSNIVQNQDIHPIESNMDLDERKKTIVKAIQWIDEIIL
jgi:hypothetical protein